tara:strand:- start:1624 stop:1767 length:144 start_codon:yes stop_codon:yes gene_type:complete
MTEEQEEQWAKSGHRMSRVESRIIRTLNVVFSVAIIGCVISLLVGGA